MREFGRCATWERVLETPPSAPGRSMYERRRDQASVSVPRNPAASFAARSVVMIAKTSETSAPSGPNRPFASTVSQVLLIRELIVEKSFAAMEDSSHEPPDSAEWYVRR